MASLADIFAEVKLDLTRQEEGKLKRRIGNIDTRNEGRKVAARFGVGFNGAFGGIASKSVGAFAAGFAAIKGLQVFGGFINDARESAKISRITENAIRATGGAAKISASQVGDLATAISNKTAIDDEQIQSAANMLLTFKNIRNETGKGNDVFNQATQAAADLSVQFGGIDGASKQLGKALNDPIKGTTALAKAGVTFTDQQKKQIETLVKSGNTLGAQKIILKEIQGQVGGAAAAAADPMERLKVVSGNLAEQVGGFLLPAVNKFANFATNTAIPGVQALFAAFQEGDVTSDGFVGVMERIGVAARGAFGFFKAEVLPRLKEFGGFVIGTAVPAVVQLGRNLAATLGPAVRDVFGFVKAEVLPRLQDFAGFLGDKVLPKVGQLATSLSKNKDFLVPFVGTIVAVVAALKTWAVVQGILNVVLAANPIGLVVVALAALVGGLVYAYKHSDTFRAIVDAAFRIVAAAGKFMWNTILKPLLSAFASSLKSLWLQAQTFARIVSAAWDAIKEPARVAIKFVVDKFLGMVGSVLYGAEKAFGWVPGIGPKLKNAVTEFQKFRTSVNNALDGIKDQSLNFEIKYTDKGVNLTSPGAGRVARAAGGPISGPGTGTSDSIPAMLSNGEHVWTAKEVAAAGGHQAMYQMRHAVRRGIRGFARGGAADFDLKLRLGSASGLASTVRSTVLALATPVAKALAASNGPLQRAMNFGRSQVGKPYLWGGVGPNGYDCSGFVSALINVAQGRSPYRRLGATGSMPWSMMAPGNGRFMVGWFRGNPGHTAASINGVPFESAGGVGVRVGGRARGAFSSLFTNRMHVKGFARGGRVEGRDGDLPFDLLKNHRGLRQELGLQVFDQGGPWRSGTLGLNMSGKTETVVPGGGEVRLDVATIRAIGKEFARAFSDGKLRIVGQGNHAYVLEKSIG